MNIFRLFTKRNKEEEAIVALANSMHMEQSHLIALCRLLFIKPEHIVREAHNYKANAEYLVKMTEAKEKII